MAVKFFDRDIFAHLRSLEFYVPGRRTDEVAREYGFAPEEILKLGSAENPLGPPPGAIAEIKKVLSQLSLYPDFTQSALRERIAEYNGVASGNIVAGVGEMELMSLIVRTFSDVGDEVMMAAPSFPMYEKYTVANKRKPVFFSLDENFEYRQGLIGPLLSKATKIIFLASPNNPTSKIIRRDVMGSIISMVPGDVLIVIDEAYNDFSDQDSFVDLLGRCENIIVMRTFSKAFGLAGLRIGYAIADARAAELLHKANHQWNINCLAAAGAIGALNDDGHYQKTVSFVRESRSYFIERLREFPQLNVIMEPQANFLMLRIEKHDLDSVAAFQKFLRKGIILKDCSLSYRGLGKKYLRVDVPPKAKVDIFIERLKDILI